MSESSNHNLLQRMEELVQRMLDESLTDAEHADLLGYLQQDPAAREYFLQQSVLHSLLRERGERHHHDSLCSQLFGVRQEELSTLAPLTAQLTGQSMPPTLPAPAIQNPNEGLSSGGGLSSNSSSMPGAFGAFGALGAFFTIVSAVGLWMWIGNRPADGPGEVGPRLAAKGNDSPENSDSPDSAVVTAQYVARIVKASADCVWGELDVPAEFLLRVRAGDRMHVVSGLVEMEFFSGARVILHGPAMFTPTGPASGHLESGRLTGEVSKGDFRLVTPAAEVVDLGTAFGVVADSEAGTDVVVFDGKVQVVSRGDRTRDAETVNMTEGMAARFRLDGTTEYGLKTDANQFARRISPSRASENSDEVCLIDVIAGGNGVGDHLAGAIDPMTGQRDYGEEGRKSKHFGRWTDGAFHGSSWHPLIDGVFVPSPEGQRVQTDSLGGVLDLPRNTGTTHGLIWARRKESIRESGNGPDNDFWGTRTLKGVVEKLKTVRTGLVGMHANVGMTIDLRRLRMVHRRAANEFRATVANIENSADWAAHERPVPEVETRIADCRVFVDGGLRTSRLGFCREDGDVPLSVRLLPDDRFLTIVVTDGDGEMRFDHVVLVDPVIRLDREP